MSLPNVKGNWAAASNLKLKTTAGRRFQLTDLLSDGGTMSKLIEALQIFLKYGDPDYPTNCSHDELTICGIDPAAVSDEDKAKLDMLGFFVSETDDCFKSFLFGSA